MTKPGLEAPDTVLLIYFPGNSLNRYERRLDLQEVHSAGMDLLIFDYRGFGDSSGSPTEAALTGDAEAIWRYAVDDLGYSPDQIVIFGESLGGAVAVSLWRPDGPKPQPFALVLNSTFYSMKQTVVDQYPYFPFHWFLMDTWASCEVFPQINCQISVFHGTEDEMIPLGQAKRLTGANPRSELIVVNGGTHNEIPTQRLKRRLTNLLNEATATD